MIFQQQKQEYCENENEDCKTAMILMKNKTVNDKTIITAAISLSREEIGRASISKPV